jgi:hypothetical protein
VKSDADYNESFLRSSLSLHKQFQRASQRGRQYQENRHGHEAGIGRMDPRVLPRSVSPGQFDPHFDPPSSIQ